jgi:hypothetical protein
MRISRRWSIRVAKRLGLDRSKVFVDIDRFGNTSAASIPIALCDAVAQDRVRQGDTLVFAAFGGQASRPWFVAASANKHAARVTIGTSDLREGARILPVRRVGSDESPRFTARTCARWLVVVAGLLLFCSPAPLSATPVGGCSPLIGTHLDVVFHSPRAATFSPVFAIRGDTTYVAIADLVTGRLCTIGNWPNAQLDDVYAGQDGSLLVLDEDATLVSIAGGPFSKGPRQSVGAAIFARDSGGTRVLVSLSNQQQILDITMPTQPRQIAPFEASFLGQLDDGSLVVATSAGVGENATRTIGILGLDGARRAIATVSHARFVGGLRTAPNLDVLVDVIGGRNSSGQLEDTLVAVDLASGEQTVVGKVQGPVFSFAARKTHPGMVVVESDGSSQRIVGRDAPSFGPVAGGIGGMGWSPDDSLLAVHTLSGEHVFSEDGTVLLDINLTGLGSVRAVGWLRR